MVEGQIEHVMQHKRHSLGGRQRVEDHEQRRPDGVREDEILRWITRDVPDAARRVGRFDGLLPPGLARPEHVETDARHDRGQPAV
jgi:hypothetical protein